MNEVTCKQGDSISVIGYMVLSGAEIPASDIANFTIKGSINDSSQIRYEIDNIILDKDLSVSFSISSVQTAKLPAGTYFIEMILLSPDYTILSKNVVKLVVIGSPLGKKYGN